MTYDEFIRQQDEKQDPVSKDIDRLMRSKGANTEIKSTTNYQGKRNLRAETIFEK